MTVVRIGVVGARAGQDPAELRAAVHGGFVHVDGEGVVILAGVAELASEIDVARRAPPSRPPRAGSVTGPRRHRNPGRRRGPPVRASRPSPRTRTPPRRSPPSAAPGSASRRRGPPRRRDARPGPAGLGHAPPGAVGGPPAPAARDAGFRAGGRRDRRPAARPSAERGSGASTRTSRSSPRQRPRRRARRRAPAAPVGGQSRPGRGEDRAARTFAPRTPVIYLEVTGDTAGIAGLRRRLTVRAARPGGRAPRACVRAARHGRRARGGTRIAAALETLADFQLTATLASVMLCEQDEAAPATRRHVVADVALGSGSLVGRGGRELHLRRLDAPRPRGGGVGGRHPGRGRDGGGRGIPPTREPFVVTAYAGDRPVAAVVGTIGPGSVEIHKWRLDEHRHGEGIGGQLVRALEGWRLARLRVGLRRRRRRRARRGLPCPPGLRAPANSTGTRARGAP